MQNQRLLESPQSGKVGWGWDWKQRLGELLQRNSFLLLRKKTRFFFFFFTVPLTAHELICESI